MKPMTGTECFSPSHVHFWRHCLNLVDYFFSVSKIGHSALAFPVAVSGGLWSLGSTDFTSVRVDAPGPGFQGFFFSIGMRSLQLLQLAERSLGSQFLRLGLLSFSSTASLDLVRAWIAALCVLELKSSHGKRSGQSWNLLRSWLSNQRLIFQVILGRTFSLINARRAMASRGGSDETKRKAGVSRLNKTLTYMLLCILETLSLLSFRWPRSGFWLWILDLVVCRFVSFGLFRIFVLFTNRFLAQASRAVGISELPYAVISCQIKN